ncbi:hypothetical protein, partial [Acinetobacter baumannii]|uniref:hypothetical protein n=1 Tax=Acinetobacter baumannii TaxID=470 RepID=UPI001C07301E
FRVVSEQEYGVQIYHEKVRRICVEYMGQNQQLFAKVRQVLDICAILCPKKQNEQQVTGKLCSVTGNVGFLEKPNLKIFLQSKSRVRGFL